MWCEKQARLLCQYNIITLPLLLGLDERDQENTRVRYCDFKHKYITNTSITTGDAIVSVAKHLTSALHGSIPPPLVKSGINHLSALRGIFDATKEGYDER